MIIYYIIKTNKGGEILFTARTRLRESDWNSAHTRRAIPGLNDIVAVSNTRTSSFSLRCTCSLRCLIGHMPIDISGYVCLNCSVAARFLEKLCCYSTE